MEIKWTDEELEPANTAARPSLLPLVLELTTQPGRWAESARYPVERIGSARSRGAQAIKRYAKYGLEYAVREEDGEAVLYMRTIKGE